jgi:hypothetical protein
MRTDVNDCERVKLLIAEAIARMGSQRKLAKALKTNPSAIGEWRDGLRSCPVKHQALMADIAGMDGAAVALHAIVESESDPQRKEQLLRVLGKAFRQHGAVAWSVLSASALWACDAGTDFIRCILC